MSQYTRAHRQENAFEFKVPGSIEDGSDTAVANELTALCEIARVHQTATDSVTPAHRIGLQPIEPLATDVKFKFCKTEKITIRALRKGADCTLQCASKKSGELGAIQRT